MSAIDLEWLVAASSLAELCWLGPDGAPRVRGVVPLWRDGRPALAFLYADQGVALEVASAGQVALVLAETRSTSPGFSPTALRGRPSLLEDPAGEAYVGELVVQELRRYPPSRLFADSPVLMRENWWWLPRLVVEVDVEAAEPTAVRRAPYDHLLAVADGERIVVRAAGRVADSERGGEPAPVGVDGPAPPPGPAVLFGQDASFPDLELWSQWQWKGRWDGSDLVVVDAPARTGLGRPPGLLQRWRRQRDLQRRCEEAIPRA